MIYQPLKKDQEKYLTTYLKGFEKDDLVEELMLCSERTKHLLKNISEEKAKFRYAEGKWSVKQVVRHITDWERVFNYRALSISRQPNCNLVGLDENVLAENDNSENLSLKQILIEYDIVRQSTIHLYQTMDPKKLDQEGLSNGVLYSSRMLGWVCAGHNIHHLRIIGERYLNST